MPNAIEPLNSGMCSHPNNFRYFTSSIVKIFSCPQFRGCTTIFQFHGSICNKKITFGRYEIHMDQCETHRTLGVTFFRFF